MQRQLDIANGLFHCGLILMLVTGAAASAGISRLTSGLMLAGALVALAGRLTFHLLRCTKGQIRLAGPGGAPLPSLRRPFRLGLRRPAA